VLEEIATSNRSSGNSLRRWFSDSSLDLYIWEDDAGSITRFQLCYGKGNDEHAFTWLNSGSWTHHKVDDGEAVGQNYKSSPILIPDGRFDPSSLAKTFMNNSKNIDPDFSTFVFNKLMALSGGLNV
jgi:hypothetical protein